MLKSHLAGIKELADRLLVAFKFFWWVASMIATISTQLGHTASAPFYRWAAIVSFIASSIVVWWIEHKRVLKYETPKLRISLPDLMGDNTTHQADIYFHLNVENLAMVSLHNCKVYLCNVVKFNNGEWVGQRVPHQSPLTWQGTPPKNQERNIDRMEVVDFGCLPLVDPYPPNTCRILYVASDV